MDLYSSAKARCADARRHTSSITLGLYPQWEDRSQSRSGLSNGKQLSATTAGLLSSSSTGLPAAISARTTMFLSTPVVRYPNFFAQLCRSYLRAGAPITQKRVPKQVV